VEGYGRGKRGNCFGNDIDNNVEACRGGSDLPGIDESSARGTLGARDECLNQSKVWCC
jgi:hypothetical protein